MATHGLYPAAHREEHSMTSTSRRLLAAALAASIPFALTACGDSGRDGGPTETVTAHSTATPSPTSSRPTSTTSSEPTTGSSTSAESSTSPAAGGGPAAAACSAPPSDADEYADLYVRAWGVGDTTSMRCLAADEAVSYTVDYRAEAGPGWVRLDATGGPTRTVRYGSPNHKTTLTLTVDGSRLGGPKAVTTALIG